MALCNHIHFDPLPLIQKWILMNPCARQRSFHPPRLLLLLVPRTSSSLPSSEIFMTPIASFMPLRQTLPLGISQPSSLFAAHHNYPLTVQNCLDIAAFQVAYPLAVIRPFSKSLPRFLYGVAISSRHPWPPRSSPPPPSPGCLFCSWHASVFVSSLGILIFPFITVTTRGAQPSSRHFKGDCSSSVALLQRFKGGRPPISGDCYTGFPRLFIWCFSLISSSPLPPPPRPRQPRYSHLFGHASLSSSVWHHPSQPSLRSGFLPLSTAEHWRNTIFRNQFPRQSLQLFLTLLICKALRLMRGIAKLWHLWCLRLLVWLLRCILCPLGTIPPLCHWTLQCPVGLLHHQNGAFSSAASFFSGCCCCAVCPYPSFFDEP